VLSIAKAKNCTNAQVVYNLAQSLGIMPLAGSTNEQHMKDGVEAGKLELGEHLDQLKSLIGY
jgi:diketogulonate reductase-like aldo/keto reductase